MSADDDLREAVERIFALDADDDLDDPEEDWCPVWARPLTDHDWAEIRENRAQWEVP